MSARARWLVLEPLDTLIVRDGRAFDAGTNSESRAVTPSPTTIAGAVGAAFGAAPGAGRTDPAARGQTMPDHLQGPIVVAQGRRGWEPRWPVPRDVIRPAGTDTLIRLTPVPLQAGESCDLDGEVDVFLDDGGQDSAPADGWWGTSDLNRYLKTETVASRPMPDPWQIERRVGLARGPDRLAAEGMFYSTEHLRPSAGHGFAVRCTGGPATDLPPLVNLGGRGRRAQVHQPDEIPMPQPPEDFPGGRLLLYLATPAVFPGGTWRPDLSRWPGTRLVTAAIGPAQPITTAIPRRTRGAIGGGLLMWAVPAGSVYYLRFSDEAAAARAAAELHHDPARHDGPDQTIAYIPLEQEQTWLSTAGFGLAFCGTWDAPDE